MNTSHVNWFKVILCLLLYCVECTPDVKHSKQCANRCQFDIEKSMHPYHTFLRKKRINIPLKVNDDETSTVFWQKRAQNLLRMHINKERNENIAKNVIFFLGDGMSIPTITAARIYLGQKHGTNGEDYHLSFESFPYVGLSKTYCIDKQVPDSACTATAYLSGIKANFLTIGVNGRVQFNDCKAAQNQSNRVQSLLALAQQAGKGTGIVTTTSVTHASPAGTYASTPNRRFECDADVIEAGQDPNDCEDIASQLILNNPGKMMKVIFGGGRTKFLPKSINDTDRNEGEREDGKNLITEWQNNKKNAKFIVNRDELNNLNINDTEYVLGLFSPYHMDFNLEADHTKQPSLVEMTESAIKILQKGDNGYFLFVEGGLIDHAHHSAQAVKALDETIQFSDAIERAVKMTDRHDTLIIVTSDHAHTMSISGYPDRGNSIIGLNSHLNEIDYLPTTTLSYANGPGYSTTLNDNGGRKNLTGTVFDSNFTYAGTFPGRQESHGGDDVAVFALGCMSHLFAGVYEQSTIPHLVSYASCLGDGLTVCKQN